MHVMAFVRSSYKKEGRGRKTSKHYKKSRNKFKLQKREKGSDYVTIFQNIRYTQQRVAPHLVAVVHAGHHLQTERANELGGLELGDGRLV